MAMRTLGRTSVAVSLVGLGAAPIGSLYTPIDDDQALEAVDAAWDGGVRYFDTAPHYGLGTSERRLGSALSGRARDQYAVSTKVGRLLVPNPAPTGSDLASGGFAVPDDLTRELDYSADGVRRSLDASLQRMGLDRIDIVYVHDPEDHLDQAVEQALPALADMRDQGIIGAIGVGMNYVEPLLRIARETDVDALMVAGRWTLLDRSAAELLDACIERQISVVAAAPFNSGLLSRPWPAEDAHFDYAPASPARLAQARRAATLCHDAGTELPAAAIQFPVRHPAVACVVVGMRTAQQARADCEWMAAPIPDKIWKAFG